MRYRLTEDVTTHHEPGGKPGRAMAQERKAAMNYVVLGYWVAFLACAMLNTKTCRPVRGRDPLPSIGKACLSALPTDV
jgi:hypothetical protein